MPPLDAVLPPTPTLPFRVAELVARSMGAARPVAQAAYAAELIAGVRSQFAVLHEAMRQTLGSGVEGLSFRRQVEPLMEEVNAFRADVAVILSQEWPDPVRREAELLAADVDTFCGLVNPVLEMLARPFVYPADRIRELEEADARGEVKWVRAEPGFLTRYRRQE